MGYDSSVFCKIMKKLSRNENISVIVELSVAIIFFLVVPSSFSSIRSFLFGGYEGKVKPAYDSRQDTSASLIIQDIVKGTGNGVRVGDQVRVHYVGRFMDGSEFDSSIKGGVPFTFTLGENVVIEGWERGIVGMKVGGVRVLIIQPELAYGKEGRGPIPANATLIFEIELLEILP